MCTQKPPNNWSEDIYQRYCVDAQQFSARAVARLAGKQGDHYVAALFDVWKGFDRYASFATAVLKYIDRFYVKRFSLPGTYKVLAEAFSGALDLEATALSTDAEDRGRDIALLRCMQGRTRLLVKERELKEVGLAHPTPLEQKWQACFAVQPAVASRRLALALMLVLCAKNPPRAVLGDDPGRLSIAVRLVHEGPFEHDGRSAIVPLILKQVTEQQYASELVRSVEELLEENSRITTKAAAAE